MMNMVTGSPATPAPAGVSSSNQFGRILPLCRAVQLLADWSNATLPRWGLDTTLAPHRILLAIRSPVFNLPGLGDGSPWDAVLPEPEQHSGVRYLELHGDISSRPLFLDVLPLKPCALSEDLRLSPVFAGHESP
jgi:hypothetical protein